MKIGTMKEVVTFLQPKLIKDEFGSTKQEFEELFTTRANVSFKSGNRSVVNDEIFNSYNYIFVVWKYHKIDETMIIRRKDKYYRIEAINDTQELIQTITTTLIND